MLLKTLEILVCKVFVFVSLFVSVFEDFGLMFLNALLTYMWSRLVANSSVFFIKEKAQIGQEGDDLRQ